MILDLLFRIKQIGLNGYFFRIQKVDIKLIFSIIATLFGLIAFFSYFKDMFALKTKPHAYTWLIWAITQGTALVALWFGGGGFGALGLLVGVILVIGVFLFSLKYGTKNITLSDTILLVIALSAILVWWQLNNPLLAVVIVTGIDIVGYIPSFRKSYHEPWSETLSSWINFTVGNIFSMAALSEYNLLTLTYLVSITIANLLLFCFCVVRRRFVRAPK